MRLSSIHVYPVKSCGGMSVQEWILGETGLEFDREWMLIEPDGTMITQRKDPVLATVRARVLDGRLELSRRHPDSGQPRDTFAWPITPPVGQEVITQVWDDRIFGVDEGDAPARWFSEILGRDVRLVRKHPAFPRRTRSELGEARLAFADGYPLLVISEASLADLNDRLDTPLPMDRFRPNLVVAGASAPHDEDLWEMFKIGNLALIGSERCTRCPITTTDQQTGERGKEPLKTLATYRIFPGSKRPCFGVNADHMNIGTVHVGDPLHIVSRKENDDPR